MECKRPTGAGGEAPSIVAGVRAVFRSRSFSGKVRSRSNKEESQTSPSTQQLPLNNSNKNNNNKNHRSPKSPFLGWRKCKLKETLESKENTSVQDLPVAEGVGTCSQSQVERISSHSSDDYAPPLGLIRNITPGQSASFQNQVDVHKNISNPSDTRSSNNNSQSLGVQSNIYVKETNNEERKSESSISCELINTSQGYVKMENCANNSYSVSEDKNVTGGSVDNKNALNKNNNIPRSGRSSSESSTNSYESLPESCNLPGYNEQRDGVVEGGLSVVRDPGDGSDTQEVCHEGKLENESCIKYFRDIYRNSKINNDCMRPRGVPVELSRGLWLKYALSYNLHVPESPRNEVSVLSLGIDQYIEEVFRYLDYSGMGKVSVEDMDALCQVLGLPDDRKKAAQQRCRCSGSNLTLNGSLNSSSVNVDKFQDSECPLHLKFNEFHNKLFTKLTQAAKVNSIVPLDCRRPNNPRLVTSVVNVQRRYDLLENISQSMSQMDAKLESEETRVSDKCDTTGVVCCKCRQMAHVDRNSNISSKPLDAETSYLQRQILLQEQELQCLREVIEDMRIALQSSDAENLALQVKIKRNEDISPRMSQADLSLTDEEDTIDNLVRQLNELDCPALLTMGAGTSSSSHPAHDLTEQQPQEDTSLSQESEKPESQEDPLNTAFISGDFSLEAELQATYEALQSSREEQEAMQVDLQHTVGQLQERESELQKIELRLREAQSALEKAQHDNHVLVMEIAETRHSLEESRSKLTVACEELRQAKDNSHMKDKHLHELQARLNLLKNFRVVPETSKIVSETSKIVSETSKIVSETSKIVPDTSKIVPETSKIVPETSKVVSETSKIVPETSKIVSETSKIVSETSKIVSETSKIVSETSKIVPETSKIVSETSKIVSETSKFVPETSKIVSETSKIVSETSKIVSETSKIVSQTSKIVAKPSKIVPETSKVVPETSKVTKVTGGYVSSARNASSSSYGSCSIVGYIFDSHAGSRVRSLGGTEMLGLDMTSRADSGLYSEDSERDDDVNTPDRSSDPISASEDDLWTPRRTSRDDSSCCSSFRSSSSTSPDSDDDPSRDTRSHLMIVEEGGLSQYKRSSMSKEDPRWSARSQPMIVEGDRSKWKSSFTGPGISSTAIIEGLEREVQWVQRKLEEAERECDEVESNAYVMEMDARWRSIEGKLMQNVRRVTPETRPKRTRSPQLDKLQQLQQALVPLPNSASHERLA
nr:uncharacterized protein LOC123744942 [Procambarus clarkii]